MRLASGIAPLKRYLAEGVRVGLGVDGSASNDGGHLLSEARQAMLLSRVLNPEGEPFLTGRQALELATRGGAAVLGRDDIGTLETGKAADLVAIDMGRLEYAGALHDPAAALVFCAPLTVDHSWVHGRQVVRHRQLMTVDVEALIDRHNRAARRLVG